MKVGIDRFRLSHSAEEGLLNALDAAALEMAFDRENHVPGLPLPWQMACDPPQLRLEPKK